MGSFGFRRCFGVNVDVVDMLNVLFVYIENDNYGVVGLDDNERK